MCYFSETLNIDKEVLMQLNDDVEFADLVLRDISLHKLDKLLFLQLAKNNIIRAPIKEKIILDLNKYKEKYELNKEYFDIKIMENERIVGEIIGNCS